ncbi:hypothetical protein [Sagittula salina]|nr:hypothetical protein [Sagittula salina]
MKLLTLMQATALVVLALMGALAAAEQPPVPCAPAHRTACDH